MLREICVRVRTLDVDEKRKLYRACPAVADCATKGKWSEVPTGMVLISGMVLIWSIDGMPVEAS